VNRQAVRAISERADFLRQIGARNLSQAADDVAHVGQQEPRDGVRPLYVLCDFAVGIPITVGLCAIAAYVVGSDAAIRKLKSFKA